MTSSSCLQSAVDVVLPPRFEDHRVIVVQPVLDRYAHDWDDELDEHTDTVLLEGKQVQPSVQMHYTIRIYRLGELNPV